MSKRSSFGILLEKTLANAFGDWRNSHDWLPNGYSLSTIEKWVDEGTLPQPNNFYSFLSSLSSAISNESTLALKDAYFEYKNQRRRLHSKTETTMSTEDQPTLPYTKRRIIPLIGLPNVIAQIDPNRLIGVESVGQHLVQKLQNDEARFISIEGQGGLGKTATALWTIDRLRQLDTFVGVLWITVGENYSFTSGLGNNFDDQSILEQIAQMVQADKALAILQETPYLIIVDNIQTKEEAQFAVEALQTLALGASRVLMTSRFNLSSQFKFVFSLELQPLSKREVHKLLREYSRVKFSREKMDEIYEVVGGVPLALHLISSLAQTESISLLLDGIKRATGDELDKRGRISAMFEYIYGSIWQQLSETAREFIVLFARQSPADGTIPREYALVSCCAEDQCIDTLEQLLQYYLLTSYGVDDDTYLVIHELTRAYIRTRKAQSPDSSN